SAAIITFVPGCVNSNKLVNRIIVYAIFANILFADRTISSIFRHSTISPKQYLFGLRLTFFSLSVAYRAFCRWRHVLLLLGISFFYPLPFGSFKNLEFACGAERFQHENTRAPVFAQRGDYLPGRSSQLLYPKTSYATSCRSSARICSRVVLGMMTSRYNSFSIKNSSRASTNTRWFWSSR